MPVLIYKQFNEDGTKNDLFHKSGLDRLRFMPVFFYSSGFAQNFAFNMHKDNVYLDFEDELITLQDGGHTYLSWNYDSNRTKKGIVIIVPGIVGDSTRMYIVNTAIEAKQNGFNSVVVNHRGGNKLKITTPKMCSELSHDDLRDAIDFIHSKYPDDKLYAVGFSIGASIVWNYIDEASQNDDEILLKGAVCISPLFNQSISHLHIEKYFFGLPSKSIAKSYKVKIQEQSHMYPQIEKEYGIDIKQVFSEKYNSCHGFVDSFVSKMGRCSNPYEYYEKAKLDGKLKNMKVKTLFISSYDDIIIGKGSAPIDEFKTNQNTYLMMTHAGGHVAYLYKLFQPKQWFTIPALKFIDYLNSSNKHE